MSRLPPLLLEHHPWPARLVGLPFLLIGGWLLVVTLTGLGTVTVTMGGTRRPAGPEDAWLPGVFVAVGLLVVFWRWTRVLDGPGRRVIAMTGWGPWVRQHITDLQFAERIVLRPAEVRQHGKHRPTVHPLVAVGAGGPPIEVLAPRDRQEARRMAEAVSTQLGIAWSEEAEQAVDLLTVDEAAAVPSGLSSASRIRRQQDIGGITWRLPLPPVALVIGAALFGSMAMTAVVGWIVVRPLVAEASPWLAWLPLLLVAAADGTALVVLARQGWLGGTIRWDRHQGLRVAGRTWPGADLEAIELMTAPPRGLRLLFKAGSCIIGRGLPAEELHGLRVDLLATVRAEAQLRS